jgi:hypothetical protein
MKLTDSTFDKTYLYKQRSFNSGDFEIESNSVITS